MKLDEALYFIENYFTAEDCDRFFPLAGTKERIPAVYPAEEIIKQCDSIKSTLEELQSVWEEEYPENASPDDFIEYLESAPDMEELYCRLLLWNNGDYDTDAKEIMREREQRQRTIDFER